MRIEEMATQQLGAYKRCARHAGCTLDQYLERRNAGLKYCADCKEWHKEEAFSRSRATATGFNHICRMAEKQRRKNRPAPAPKPKKKIRHAPPLEKLLSNPKPTAYSRRVQSCPLFMAEKRARMAQEAPRM